ncbi:MAG: xanthine dehydrogenase family protein molybdopterin-binding subunit [Actinomycetota bacterium]|nr:xanthine dehydrogenase family protein molybdopterin-binding subunit [Actinomycetota bacterium]
MTEVVEPLAVGASPVRIEGRAKVTGSAPYAYEHPVDHPAYLHPVQATIARGRVRSMAVADADATDGVLAVLTPARAPRLANTDNSELAILQSDDVAFRGQLIGAVIAESPEIARHAAGLIAVGYDELPHHVILHGQGPEHYAPEKVNPSYPTDTNDGDVDAAMTDAAVRVDQTYTTPMEHNNAMEPHTTVALWDDEGGRLTLWDSTQSSYSVRSAVATMLGLEADHVRVIADHVGGGFGSKGVPHAHVILAAMAARALPGRPVKLALTRQHMFSLVGYRTPTIQRVRLGAGTDGCLVAIGHDVIEQTSRLKEFAEQTAVATRVLYAGHNRRTTHRLSPLDVAVPSWMRAPGETPGVFALEVAMDELAIAAAIDPIELRVRNDPDVDPYTGKPWSQRNLVACLHEGARRFGWEQRDPTPGVRRAGDWLVGTGVASATYPYYRQVGSSARVAAAPGGRYVVSIAATDIGTGARTVLSQIAADALGCSMDSVTVELGSTDAPMATVAGGSSGTSSWGSAIVAAARAFGDQHGTDPRAGAETTVEMPEHPGMAGVALHSFGAQFAEVRINADTGEVRVPRMLGVFSAGRIINPRTARSQLIGGMTMGLSMALHEESVVDPRFGHVINHNFADYHIAAHADIGSIEATCLDETDPHANPMGSRGIGEIGIVGAAAAIANAAFHATGIRVRDLPLSADRFLI